ncbi:glycosyltransferase family 9 protein [Photobacterium chitinilyticum]|uniref:Lipopolysaccharide heptosyltransferase family protein n=1 Tax=Photobacterium chitinilyticum TaxID=2485123 RepID=A0A3S4TK37_9GAMM|nr:glycosyltransferase family 9 protein [Photobacterium chitinilyticum]RWX54368.1 lipopolysaccharide heptosyltransferase family protein [Photobacterium chitinilyticum]
MKKVLVVRNDKIGDFMLAWPSFAMLKQSLPECQITALVPNYTASIAQLCPWIDDVIIDPTSKADKAQQAGLVSQIKQRDFDAAICLFSNGYNAKLLWRAGIPYRLAPATKLAQLLFTRRLKQRRSRSEKPEFEYNLDLIRYFLDDNQIACQEPQGPYLAFAEEVLATQKTQLVAQLALDASKPWCFIHVGSGGSANNLSLEQYAALIKGVAAKHNCEFVLTAGPGEEAMAASLHSLIKADVAAYIYDKNDGLQDFTRSLACADLFIAGSTGPLHIAAALDIPTIGFFPSKRSATPLRWKTLNTAGRHLAFCPPAGKGQDTDMELIDIDAVLEKATPWAAQYCS